MVIFEHSWQGDGRRIRKWVGSFLTNRKCLIAACSLVSVWLGLIELGMLIVRGTQGSLGFNRTPKGQEPRRQKIFSFFTLATETVWRGATKLNQKWFKTTMRVLHSEHRIVRWLFRHKHRDTWSRVTAVFDLLGPRWIPHHSSSSPRVPYRRPISIGLSVPVRCTNFVRKSLALKILVSAAD